MNFVSIVKYSLINAWKSIENKFNPDPYQNDEEVLNARYNYSRLRTNGFSYLSGKFSLPTGTAEYVNQILTSRSLPLRVLAENGPYLCSDELAANCYKDMLEKSGDLKHRFFYKQTKLIDGFVMHSEKAGIALSSKQIKALYIKAAQNLFTDIQRPECFFGFRENVVAQFEAIIRKGNLVYSEIGLKSEIEDILEIAKNNDVFPYGIDRNYHVRRLKFRDDKAISDSAASLGR